MPSAWTLGLLAVSTLAAAAVPDGYAGAAACGACHPAQATRQAMSAHASALFPAPDHPLAGAFGRGGRLSRAPAFQFEFFTVDGALHTRMRDSAEVLEFH